MSTCEPQTLVVGLVLNYCRAGDRIPCHPRFFWRRDVFHTAFGETGGGLVARHIYGSDTGLLLNVINSSRGFLLQTSGEQWLMHRREHIQAEHPLSAVPVEGSSSLEWIVSVSSPLCGHIYTYTRALIQKYEYCVRYGYTIHMTLILEKLVRFVGEEREYYILGTPIHNILSLTCAWGGVKRLCECYWFGREEGGMYEGVSNSTVFT